MDRADLQRKVFEKMLSLRAFTFVEIQIATHDLDGDMILVDSIICDILDGNAVTRVWDRYAIRQ